MRRHHLVLLGGLLLSACAEVPTGPQLDSDGLTAVPEAMASLTGTVTYDFNDLTPHCDGTPVPNQVGDLTFVEALFTVCNDGSENFLLVFDPAGSEIVTNTIELDGTATQVALDGEWLGSSPLAPTVQAYDADGNPVAVGAFAFPGVRETVVLSGAGIAYFTITAGTTDFALYTVTVTYGSSDPTERIACKDGAWEAFGFRNQGQCVRFVETGKDGRL